MPSAIEEMLLEQIQQAQLPTPARWRQLIPQRQMRSDFTFGAGLGRLLIVEVDGGGPRGRHAREPGASTDCEKAAISYFEGHDFFRFTSKMVRDGRAIEILKGYFGKYKPKFLYLLPGARKPLIARKRKAKR